MINVSLYGIFLVASITTIVSPGPGVLMAVTNSMHYGLWRAQPGIVGCALGTLVVALISVTALGALVATSPMLFAAIRVLGIAYLFYLAWRKLNAKPFAFSLAQVEAQKAGQGVASVRHRTHWRLFAEGIVLQLTNPALLLFYFSLFPQCIDPKLDYSVQVALLSINYCVMVWMVHTAYGAVAAYARGAWMQPKAAIWINRVTALCYVLLGAGFAVAMLR